MQRQAFLAHINPRVSSRLSRYSQIMVPESVRSDGGVVRCVPPALLAGSSSMVASLARTLTSRTAPAFFRPPRLPASRVGLDTAGPEAEFSPWGAITVCQMRGNVGTLVTLDLSAQTRGPW
jgi:hypothetical protein